MTLLRREGDSNGTIKRAIDRQRKEKGKKKLENKKLCGKMKCLTPRDGCVSCCFFRQLSLFFLKEKLFIYYLNLNTIFIHKILICFVLFLISKRPF